MAKAGRKGQSGADKAGSGGKPNGRKPRFDWNPGSDYHTQGFEYTRHRFALLVPSHAPEVIRSLRQNVWLVYQELPVTFCSQRRLVLCRNLLAALVDGVAEDTLTLLQSRLEAWAASFNASPQYWQGDATWFMDAGLFTMYNWHIGRLDSTKLTFATLETGYFPKVSESDKGPVLTVFGPDEQVPSSWHRAPPTYSPEVETQEQYRERVEFYIESIEAAAMETREPVVKKPVATATRDFEWVVRYQLLGMSAEAIAKLEVYEVEEGLAGDRVRKAIERTAPQLGLLLRS